MPSVYLETSVVSYLAARPSRDRITAARQQVTREWWNTRRLRFTLFSSDFVVEEAARGDATAAARRLSQLAGVPLFKVTTS